MSKFGALPPQENQAEIGMYPGEIRVNRLITNLCKIKGLSEDDVSEICQELKKSFQEFVDWYSKLGSMG